jgi:methylenetetrahydrofolate dehydrogenase (NADP+)/methenyltetrahydrofolate cyclohydrolase
MAAKIIDGTALAAGVRAKVGEKVAAFKSRNQQVHLVALLVGATPAGEIYAKRQGEACEALGIKYTLMTMPDDVTQKHVRDEIRKLNKDKSVTGIMMHLPLPPHMNRARLQYEIDVVKDVEGVNPANIGYVVYGNTLIAPCTAAAVIEMILSTGIEIEGAEAVVVGASEIVGKPVSLLLTEKMATVTTCHIATRDLKLHTKRADILVVAAGKPGLIGPEHVKPGAVVVDVGINRVKQPDGTSKTVGDVQFEAVKALAGHLSPVPGGVGPMTVAMLLKNTLRSAEILYEGVR